MTIKSAINSAGGVASTRATNEEQAEEITTGETVKFTALTYEQRRLLVKTRQEAVQQKRLAELIEAQRAAREMFERLQNERKRRIEELRQREEERRRAVLARREKLLVSYQEKAEQLLKKQLERQQLSARRPSSMPAKSSSRVVNSVSDQMTTSATASIERPTIKRDTSTPCFRKISSSSINATTTRALNTNATAGTTSKPSVGRRSQSAEVNRNKAPQKGDEKDARGRTLKRAHSPLKTGLAGKPQPSEELAIAKSKLRANFSSSTTNAGNVVPRTPQRNEIKLSKTAPNQMPTIVTLQQLKHAVPLPGPGPMVTSSSLQKLSASNRSTSHSPIGRPTDDLRKRVGIPHSASLQFPVQSTSSSKLTHQANSIDQSPVPVIRPRIRSESHSTIPTVSSETATILVAPNVSEQNLTIAQKSSIVQSEGIKNARFSANSDNTMDTTVSLDLKPVVASESAESMDGISKFTSSSSLEYDKLKPAGSGESEPRIAMELADSAKEDISKNQESSVNQINSVRAEKAVVDGERVERRKRVEEIMSRVHRQSGNFTPTASPVDSPTVTSLGGINPQLPSTQSNDGAKLPSSTSLPIDDLMSMSTIVSSNEQQPSEPNSMSSSFSGTPGSLFATSTPGYGPEGEPKKVFLNASSSAAFKSPLLQGLFEKNHARGITSNASANTDIDIKSRLPMLLKNLAQNKNGSQNFAASTASQNDDGQQFTSVDVDEVAAQDASGVSQQLVNDSQKIDNSEDA